VFSSDSAFDRHCTGKFGGTGGKSTRRCMTEPEMLTAGMVIQPAKTHDGAPVWTIAASLHGWERFAERKAR
jgi:hypothetical protein